MRFTSVRRALMGAGIAAATLTGGLVWAAPQQPAAKAPAMCPIAGRHCCASSNAAMAEWSLAGKAAASDKQCGSQGCGMQAEWQVTGGRRGILCTRHTPPVARDLRSEWRLPVGRPDDIQ